MFWVDLFDFVNVLNIFVIFNMLLFDVIKNVSWLKKYVKIRIKLYFKIKFFIEIKVFFFFFYKMFGFVVSDSYLS